MASALAAFRRHLALERGLSQHTVRAYLGDVSALLGFAAGDHCTDVADLDIAVLRAWLGSQHRAGQARTTIARRAAAARAFTAFAHQLGWLSADPGAQLGTPKVHRQLPEVLGPEHMTALLAASGAAPDRRDSPDLLDRATDLRDTAILELLYATGIRVSELCGLDVGDIDESRRTVKVLGKRSKERVVPAGIPALRAVRAWQAGPKSLAAGLTAPRGASRRSSSAREAAGSTRAPSAGSSMPGSPQPARFLTPVRTDCGIRRPPTCSRAALTSAASRRSSATPRSRRRRSIRTSALTG
jgi:integrase/recombinase XerC